MALEARLVSPKEQPLFLAGAIFSSLFWLFLIVSIFGVLYGLVGLAFALVTHAIFLAYVKGNGVRVSPQQSASTSVARRRGDASGWPRCRRSTSSSPEGR